MTDEPLAEAYRAANGFQAHLVANFLTEAGIPAMVDGEDLGWVIGDVGAGWSTSPRVMVHQSRFVEARALIEAAEAFDDGPLVEDAEYPDDESDSADESQSSEA